MKTFSRHVFATLTYARDISLFECWQKTSKDFNRFFQEFRRMHSATSLQYIRVIEEHQDGFPHIHAIIQFDSACISVEASRYFDKSVYKKWRTLWKYGHSDYQPPRNAGIGTISYIMKYLIKNQTSKTVWKKILEQQSPGRTLTELQNSMPAIHSDSGSLQNVCKSPKLPTRLNGVKLCTWSRGFDFKPFKPKL